MKIQEKVIKGIEICTNDSLSCKCCPYNELKSPNCINTLRSDAFDLIKRHKEEIEQFANIGKMYSEVRAEAIREYAGKLKESAFDVDISFGYGKICYDKAVAVLEIDNLVKEMVGEEK